MQSLIASLPGDGIGVEVIAEAVHVLRAIGARFGHDLRIEEAPVGGAGILACNEAFPAATKALCQRSDAILLGAIGDPRWSDMNAKIRPETALIDLRGGFGLYANIRPVRPVPALFASSPLKPEVLRGVDILFVRELTGGIYFGKKERAADAALDTCTYTVAEIERIVRVAGKLARQRKKQLCSVDKNNVLATSKLWREVSTRVVATEFPDVALEHLLVDAFAMHLLRRPRDFDVVVTENLFGDVLTDEASVLCGSLGMLPSASLGANKPGLFEPVHGSAPDIAGQGISNPYGAILTVGMLLRHALGLEEEAQNVELAVERALGAGVLTRDLGGGASTREVGRAVIAAL